jgi:hypothetical protein
MCTDRAHADAPLHPFDLHPKIVIHQLPEILWRSYCTSEILEVINNTAQRAISISIKANLPRVQSFVCVVGAWRSS